MNLFEKGFPTEQDFFYPMRQRDRAQNIGTGQAGMGFICQIVDILQYSSYSRVQNKHGLMFNWKF